MAEGKKSGDGKQQAAVKGKAAKGKTIRTWPEVGTAVAAASDPEEGGPGEDMPDFAGHAGGRLPRDVGSRDELRRAEDARAGLTRVRKSDEAESIPHRKIER